MKWSEICQFWLISWIYCSYLYHIPCAYCYTYVASSILTLSVVSVALYVAFARARQGSRASMSQCISWFYFFFIWIHVSIFVHPLSYAHLLFVLMVSDMWHIIFLRRFFLCMCNMYVVRSLVSKVYLMCVQNIWKNFFFCISSFYEVLYVSYAYKQRHGSHTWMFVFMKENRFWLFLIIIVIHSKCT